MASTFKKGTKDKHEIIAVEGKNNLLCVYVCVLQTKTKDSSITLFFFLQATCGSQYNTNDFFPFVASATIMNLCPLFLHRRDSHWYAKSIVLHKTV